MPRIHSGDAVWFRPDSIGYGYVYGIDKGIPATVLADYGRDKTGRQWWLVAFVTKDGTPVAPRRVVETNLEPRVAV